MYPASGAIRSAVADQQIGDDAVTRRRRLVGRRCILYADDIILLSASVTGLKHMLKCCYVSCELSLKFNCSKPYCYFVGKSVKSAIADLYLGTDSIQWSTRVKYLGLSYHTGKKLTVNTDRMKQNFFYGL